MPFMTCLRFLPSAPLMRSAGHAIAHSDAPITAVVLFPRSATIERTAQIGPGMKQLEIKGLPANFDTQTLRVPAEISIVVCSRSITLFRAYS